jgi:tRNA-2-methylthio-N6-dimethylallyladenosine synthase
VGFPGETKADFEDTLSLVEEARFSGAYTFLYSKRPGTPAADMPGQLPRAVVQERYERLVALVDAIAWRENQAFEGREVEVLVAHGEGRKDAATSRLSGRARDNRLVHFTPGSLEALGGVPVRPGDVVTAQVTYAAPHHLVSDLPVTSVRRTRAGDAWQPRDSAPGGAVLLGIPTRGVPEPVPTPAGACVVTTAS